MCYANKPNILHHIPTVNMCVYKSSGCAYGLCKEVYSVHGVGALSSNANPAHLTDSVSFKLYVGPYRRS